MSHPTTAFAPPAGPSATDLVKCVRCGLCLGACPTYDLLGLETDSPRGRIHLMRGLAEGRLELSEGVVRHLDQCLGCRACETVCPSDVPFGRLLEATRAVIADLRPTPGWRGRLQRLAFRQLLPSRQRLQLVASALRALHRSGLLRHAQRLPGALGAAAALVPPAPDRPYAPPVSGRAEALGPRRGTVILFQGCIMPVLFGAVMKDTEEALRFNGLAVTVPADQTCCGALMAHAGERRLARELARRNIDALAGDDPIVVNAAGCGAQLKEYGHLLADDPDYAARAVAFAARVRDVTELLAEIGLTASLGPIERTVVYQDACHLVHGQGIRRQPRQLLGQIPGLRLIELPASDRCCGSAGIYNLTHPEIAGALRERKVDEIVGTGADAVAVANPGCLLQIAAGLHARGAAVAAIHPVSLLADACRRGQRP